MEKGEGAAPQKVRDPFFDNAKFVLITLVVIGHAYTSLRHESEFIKSAYFLIYSFHMPLFILISGYFTKNFNKPEYFRKTISSALIPYLIFEAIFSCFPSLPVPDREFKTDLSGSLLEHVVSAEPVPVAHASSLFSAV